MVTRVLSRLRVVAGLIVSVVCVALLLWNVDWALLLRVLAGAGYGWLALSLVALLAEVWLRTLRWKLLLAPARRVPTVTLLHGMLVGYLANAVLPGRLGELARTALLVRLEGIEPVVVLATVAVDRILDVVVLALLLALVLPTADLPSWVGGSGFALGSLGVLLLGLCFLLAYPFGRRFLKVALDISPAFWGKHLLYRWIDALCLGMEGLRGVAAVARMVLVSVTIWTASCAMFYFGLRAFDLPVPTWAALLVTTLTSLGAVVPSSPGYVGVFHYLVVLALGAYHVEREAALGYAVTVHLLMMLPLGLLGSLSLWRCGFGLGGLLKGGIESQPTSRVPESSSGGGTCGVVTKR